MDTAGEIIVQEGLTPSNERDLILAIASALDAERAAGFKTGVEAAADHLLAPEQRQNFVLQGPRCLAVAATAIRALAPPEPK